MGIMIPGIMHTKLWVCIPHSKNTGHLDSVIQKRRENDLVRDCLGCREHSSLWGTIHSAGRGGSYPTVNGRR